MKLTCKISRKLKKVIKLLDVDKVHNCISELFHVILQSLFKIIHYSS